MGTYSQTDRPMRVDTPLETDTLLLEGFEGDEGVSRPFLYTVDLMSEDPEIDPAALLREPMLITVQGTGGRDPHLTHGLVRSFQQLGMHEDLVRYRVELVPAFWFLTQTTDCRIWQNKTVLEIVEEVLGESRSIGTVRYDVRCNRNYPQREYCVQYRESDFNFVSRLLEDEGIFYWFEHSDSDHTLVLADAHTAFQPCPGYEAVRLDVSRAEDEELVRGVVREHAARSYEVELRDYDPLQPSHRLYGTARGEQDELDPVFDYPGIFTDLDAGEYLARVDLERREKVKHRVTGNSTCRGFRSGFVFELEGHYRDDANRAYYLDRIRHSAHSGSYRAWDDAEFHYYNDFVALPDDVPYRPDVAARRPRVQGTQTAVVVGKRGEEVWVDEHGRVKVQFHWDRYGNNDENSSCWIRVGTLYAGKNWGRVAIPRIGHEVIVDFLEGDPDRPIIVGSVYNAEMTPPYPLPEKGVKSGVKTRSSKGGGGYNEIALDDKKGAEKIIIHAQKDMSTTVGNNQTRQITNNRTTTVGNDDDESVAQKQTITVGTDQKVDVGGNQSETVALSRSITVGTGDTLSVGTDLSQTVGSSASLNAGGAVGITAGTQMELTATTDGIYQAGVNLDLSAGVEVGIGATTVKVNAAGQVEIIGGAAVKVSAGAALELQGATVKITGGMIQLNGMVKLN